MDVGNKTLAQLSEEGKEKKYVTIDVASKISGYTRDYLERLCRLNKIEYRLWNNGQFVLELESLLRETQTILLSYEDVDFVNKDELTDPFPQIVGSVLDAMLRTPNPQKEESPSNAIITEKVREGIAHDMPSYGTANAARTGGISPAFSYVGRVVVSDPLHPEATTEGETHVPISVSMEEGERFAEEENMKSAVRILAEPLRAVATPPESTSSQKSRIHLAIKGEEEDAGMPSIESQGVAASAPLPSGGADEAELLRRSVVHLAIRSENAEDGTARPSSIPSPVIPPMLASSPATPDTDQHPAIGVPPLRSDSHVTVFEPGQDVTPATPVDPGVIHHASLEQADPRDGLPMVTDDHLPIVRPSELPAAPRNVDTIVRPSFPLVSHVGFNVIFAAFILAGASLFFAGKLPQGFDPVASVASVANAILPSETTEDEVPPRSDEYAPLINRDENGPILPFSDEIATSTGPQGDTIIIRPVFRDEVGEAFEYSVERR